MTVREPSERSTGTSEATKLAEAGRLKPVVEPRRFTLESVADAPEAVRARTARGKVVIDIAQ
jgi:NADPH2:quinone reductase